VNRSFFWASPVLLARGAARFDAPTLLRATLVSLTLLLGLGCNQGKKSGPVSKTACADYEKRICKESGDTSQTCTNVKAVLEILPPEACEQALAKVDFSVKKLGEKRKKCDELVTKLCADIGPETGTCTMVKDKTKEFPPERCDMMMQHYAEVLTDLKRQEEKNKPLSPEKQAKMAEGDAPAFGPKDAKVTIVEFSDFECPFCSRAAEASHKIKEKYGDKVRFIFRQFPLSFHAHAHLAAEAALAANAQGKFWEYHDKLFANQKALERDKLEGYAKELGLDLAKFKKALDDKAHAATVDAELKLGEEVAVDGTPTMFLNGARVTNPTDFDALAKDIDKALGG
jgi:protein-disulfide isomerase